MAVLAVCLFLIGQTCFQSFRHRLQQDELKKMTEAGLAQGVAENAEKMPADAEKEEKTAAAAKEPENVAAAADGADNMAAAVGERVMLDKYAELYAANHDLAGWLSIAGMKIDNPVMQSGDDEYYLHHDFYGNDSKYGCLYVRERADLERGSNFIIYGHNMKDGSMFGELDRYSEESFYKEHAVISFDTLYEERLYEIVAVFFSQVYDEEDDAFMYYRFYEVGTQEAFADFYGNMKALSLYDTGVEAQLGDTFLTLSTCAYHVENGRFVVVAKRVR